MADSVVETFGPRPVDGGCVQKSCEAGGNCATSPLSRTRATAGPPSRHWDQRLSGYHRNLATRPLFSVVGFSRIQRPSLGVCDFQQLRPNSVLLSEAGPQW